MAQTVPIDNMVDCKIIRVGANLLWRRLRADTHRIRCTHAPVEKEFSLILVDYPWGILWHIFVCRLSPRPAVFRLGPLLGIGGLPEL